MISFDQFLKERHPAFFLGKRKHNELLLNLYHDTHMQTDSGSLRYDRSPNFFDFSDLQGHAHYTFCVKDRDCKEKLCIMGGLVLQDVCYQDRTITIGYFCDLRIHLLKVKIAQPP